MIFDTYYSFNRLSKIVFLIGFQHCCRAMPCHAFNTTAGCHHHPGVVITIVIIYPGRPVCDAKKGCLDCEISIAQVLRDRSDNPARHASAVPQS